MLNISTKTLLIILEKKYPNVMLGIYKMVIEIFLQHDLFDLYTIFLSSVPSKKIRHVDFVLMRRYYSLSYIIHYFKLDLKESYASKVMWHILMERTCPHRSKEYRESHGYLSLMMTSDMCILVDDKIKGIYEYFRLTGIDKINHRLWMIKSRRQYSKKIYIFGPLSNVADCKYSENREMILFKPYKACEHYSNNVTLFLNQNYTTEALSDVINACKDDYYGMIYVRNKLPKGLMNLEKVKVYKEHSRFSNLLAINRVLYSYLHSYNNIDISITGLTYYLSRKKYSREYLECFKKENHISDQKRDLMQMAVHDVLFNFMFTKRLVECSYLKISNSNEFKKIISMTPSEFCVKFKEINALL